MNYIDFLFRVTQRQKRSAYSRGAALQFVSVSSQLQEFGMTNKHRSFLFGSAFIALAASAALTPAKATFVISTNQVGEQKFYINGANKGATSFFGSVGVNNSVDFVDVTTNGAVDTGSGFANIKPAKNSTLTSLTFTPTAGNDYEDMFFRGQVNDACKSGCTFDGKIFASITDQNSNVTNLTFPGVSGNSPDFGDLGFRSFDGEIIKSVTISVDSTGVFKEFKQVQFSPAGAVPEPATWAMLLIGFAGLGLAGYRTSRKSSASLPT